MAKNGNIHPTRIFETPEQLYAAFKEYKEDLKEQSKDWVKIQYVGKDALKKVDEYKLPLTFEGFCVYAYEKYGTIQQYFKNQQGLYEDFVPICSHIKQEIRTNQITGGLLGVFNPSITQRLNNLVEKTENKNIVAPDVSIELDEGEEE